MYELDNPYYFYLLALVPVVVLFYLWMWFWKRRTRKAFGDPDLLSRLAPERSHNKPFLKLVLALLIISSLALALVNPKVGTELETVKREGVDLVFAMDVSKSMLAEDVRPNRLEKSRQIISRTLDQLVGDRVGIIIYAGRAYPQLPITTDYAAARLFLKNVSTDIIPSQGTAIAGAIELATEYFDDEEQTNRVLVLFTDGEDHEQGYLEAAEKAREKGITILSVGIGTEQGGPIPEIRQGRTIGYKQDRQGEVVITKLVSNTLREIARQTNGGYIHGTSTRETVDFIIDTIEEMEKKEFEAQLFADYEDQFQWFLGLALLLLVLDALVLERKTQWFKKLGLFENDDEKID